jgi:hypothetical protein
MAASPATPADIKRLNGTAIPEKVLTARIQELVLKAHVHGAAVSIFNDRELVYSRAFGVKRTDTNEPLASTPSSREVAEQAVAACGHAPVSKNG